MYRIKLLSLLAFLLAFVLVVPSAMAARPHFIGDVLVDVDLDEFLVTVDGKIAGLGNEDVTITVTVNGTAEIIVFNPASNKPPGKNKFPFHDLTQVIVQPDPKNGSVTFSIVADFGDTLQDALDDTDLPNPNWTAELQNVDVTSVKITVEQGGKIVLSKTVKNL